MELTKAQLKALGDFNSDIQNQIDLMMKQAGNPIRYWDGKTELKNPNTGEKVGERETKNVDLPVDMEVFKRGANIIEKIKGSGHYIRGNFCGVELIAITARHDAVRNTNVLQFTFENQGQKADLGTEEGRNQLVNFLNQPRATVKTNGSTAKVDAKASVTADPDPFA